MSTLKLKNIKALEGTGADAVNFTAADQANFVKPVIQPGGFMFRNKIINGGFDIWQRSTSQTANGYGSADRWFVESVGSTKNISRESFTLGQTDVSDNPVYFMRNVITSVTGAGNYAVMYQKIEGVQTFAAKSVTLSFWAKADANKNIAVEFVQNFGTGGTPSAEVNGINPQLINLTTSWSKHTVSVTMPSISGKTLGTDGNSWMSAIFWFDAGSNNSARTASLGQQSGTFDIAQVQLEEGSSSTPFEMRPVAMELPLCQRYYYKTTGGSVPGYLRGSADPTKFFVFQLPVTMRTSPTCSAIGVEEPSTNRTVVIEASGITHVVVYIASSAASAITRISNFVASAEL